MGRFIGYMARKAKILRNFSAPTRLVRASTLGGRGMWHSLARKPLLLLQARGVNWFKVSWLRRAERPALAGSLIAPSKRL